MSSQRNRCVSSGELFSINYTDPLENTITEWCLLLRRGPAVFSLRARERDEYQLNKFRILTLKEGFQEGVAALRVRHNISPKGMAQTEMGRWSSEAFKPIEAFVEWGKGIDSLLQESRASMRWKHVFEFYVVFDSLELTHLLPRRYTYTITVSKDMPETIHLEIYKDTSQEDILKAWGQISKMQDLLINPGMTKGERHEVLRRRNKSRDPESPDYFGGQTERRLQGRGYDMAMLQALGVHYVGVKQARKAAKSKELDRYQRILKLKKDGQSHGAIAKMVHMYRSDSSKVGRDLTRINELIMTNVLY